jgi:hypothetical protein
MKLARAASARAVGRLIELMESPDERVATVACQAILDRAFGKPNNYDSATYSLDPELEERRRQTRANLMAALQALAVPEPLPAGAHSPPPRSGPQAAKSQPHASAENVEWLDSRFGSPPDRAKPGWHSPTVPAPDAWPD